MEFDKLAARYRGLRARRYDDSRVRDAKWQFENDAVGRFLSRVTTGSAILDVPVGTGRFLDLYKKLGLDVTGIDASSDMLAEAADKAHALDFACELRAGDIRAIDAPDRHFDGVLCIRFLNWIDPAALKVVLAELSRVARGFLIVGIRCALSEGAPTLSFWQRLRERRREAKRKRAGTTRFAHDEAAVAAIFDGLGLKVTDVAHAGVGRDNTEYRIYRLTHGPAQ